MVGQKLPKREKLGIHTTIEKCCVKLLMTTVAAALEHGQNKIALLKTTRIRSQVLANLVRTECELGVIKEETYIRFSAQLVEIGKMLNGWLTYQTQKESS